MKQKIREWKTRRISIRAKLMFFAAVMAAAVIGLVWVLNVQLLVPMYNERIEKELSETADIYVNIIKKYGSIEDSGSPGGVNADFFAEITDASTGDVLTGKCLEISNAERNLVHSHNISYQCALHPNTRIAFTENGTTDWNSLAAVALRTRVLLQGDMTYLLESSGVEQMVVCRRVENRYVVMVSTDLARIGEAAGVIGFQMPLIAGLVLLLGLAWAYWFSRWFTKPLSELSGAAREMARGNYSVRVDCRTNDEIGTLADDFNTMAAEVARSSALQRDLLANISHDLRTPLTLIKGYAETVRDLTGDDPKERNEQMDIIVDEADRLSSLVNSVLELSKYSSGTAAMNPVRFDLAQLCEELAARYEDICGKNGCTMHVETDEGCEVEADPHALTRVVHNLLGNALHHAGEDGYLGVRVKKLDGCVRVEVIDHGKGISPEDLPHIFDRYYRSRADAGKTGTGLGLSIVKAILVQHGWSFGVQSEVGKGSTFWFETRRPRP